MTKGILSAFSNSVRLKLITCIAKEPKNVTQLIKNCGLSQSAVSQHLEKLRKSGIVTTHRDGKEIYYSLKLSDAAKISEELQDFVKEVKNKTR